MSNNLLLVIDSYISDSTRAEACSNLITQLRTNLPEYEILLINKSSNSFDLEKQVNYYFNYGKGFLVGYPPEEIIKNEYYEVPYVYVTTNFGTCENWFPFVGVSDHVAGIYNSFVLYEGFWYDLFPKTQFDIINGAGGWADKWKSIPKICKVSYNEHEDHIKNEFVLFYWNDKEEPMNISVKVYDQENIIHENSVTLNQNHYHLSKFPLEKELRIEKTNIYNGTEETFVEIVSPENISKFNTRFLYN